MDGDNLHEMSNPVFWKNNKNITNLSLAELAESSKFVVGK